MNLTPLTGVNVLHFDNFWLNLPNIFHCEQESSDPETQPAKGTMAGDTAEGPAEWQMSGRADGTVATL